MIQVRPVRDAQHQTDAVTVKEGHPWRRLKQKRHPEYVAIESDCAIEILNVDKDLTDARQSRANWYWGSHFLLLSQAKQLSYSTAIDVLSTSFRKRDDLMKRFVRTSAFVIALLTVSGFTECYKPVTKSQMPPHIKTVAVPAFQNNALRFKIEHRFTEAVMNELIRRGHGLRVQSEREGADAVIDGVVKSFGFSGALLDDKGRARVFEVTITAAVTVRDQQENRVLYDNQNFVFRGEFEFANDPRNFFNEEDPAVQRMARSFAESIVSTLVNGFGIKNDK